VDHVVVAAGVAMLDIVVERWQVNVRRLKAKTLVGMSQTKQTNMPSK
jgi:hypothetical protein